ncbi:MAG TPA: ankyrin repeat domain-containing protein [Pirellulales bacterium]|nr:ankyrin repeat domain-containing protein [Pirellulales bacterium]
MTELLIAHGADINATDNAGRSPIDQMLQNGRRDLAEVLRRHGAKSAGAQLSEAKSDKPSRCSP